MNKKLCFTAFFIKGPRIRLKDTTPEKTGSFKELHRKDVKDDKDDEVKKSEREFKSERRSEAKKQNT